MGVNSLDGYDFGDIEEEGDEDEEEEEKPKKVRRL